MISTPGGQIYSKDELVSMGYGGYAGWSDPAAGYDFQSTGGSGKRTSGGSTSSSSGSTSIPTAEDTAKAVMDAAAQEIKAETSFLDQYTKDNPFVFDEQAAKVSATAEYAPYYQTLLNDYLQGVDLKKQNIQDERQLLTDLNKLDTQQATQNYQVATQKAEEGYAGQGMFFSGLRERATGLLGAEQNLNTQRQGLQFGGQMNNLGLQEKGINLESGIQQRQYGEQQQEAIQSGILQRQKEAQLPYYYTMQSAYQRRFPTGELSIDAYLPPSYLRY